MLRGDPAELRRAGTLRQLQRSAGNGSVLRLLQRVVPPAADGSPAPPSGALLVGPDAPAGGQGQMSTTAFLDAVEQKVSALTEKELAGTGLAVVGCPWIAHWITYYRGRDAADVEAAVRRYAPAAAQAAGAGDYVNAIGERVRDGIRAWRITGEIPELPADGPGAPPAADPAAKPAFQRRAGAPEPPADAARALGRLGPGAPLDAGVRHDMGAAYGQDLSSVRVHTDSAAQHVVSDLGARAVAVGQDIAFAPGEYEPGTPMGDALIAHELAHVVQQQTPGTAGDTAALEHDADHAAMHAVAARWAGGATGARAPRRTAGRLRLQACLPEAEKPDRSPKQGPEAEKMAKQLGLVLHPTPAPEKAPVGMRQSFYLEQPPSVSRAGTSPGGVGTWWVQKPGEDDYHRRNHPKPGSDFTVELDQEGEWTIGAQIYIGKSQSILITKTQTVVPADTVAAEGFAKAEKADYLSYRLLMEQERLRRSNGAALDQNAGGAYISNEGPGPANPATPAAAEYFRYRVHPHPNPPPDKPKPSKYRWWAIPRDYDKVELGGRKDTGTQTTYDGEFAYFLGEHETARFTRSAVANIEIVCERVSADDQLIDKVRYKQVILEFAAKREVDAVSKMMREGAAHYHLIAEGQAKGLRASHMDVRRGTTAQLTMFVGPSAKDPKTMVLVDLTPGVSRVEYEGASVEAALADFDDGNKYPEGRVDIEYAGPPAVRRQYPTTGSSDLEAGARGTGIGSAVLVGLGLLAGLTPAAPAAPFLIAGGLAGGAAAGTMSIIDELRQAKPSAMKVAIDVAGIVGSLAGLGGAVQAVRAGAVELAMASMAGRFFVYTGFASDAIGGILLAADTAQRIEEIRNSKMSQEEKADAIARLVINAVAVGGLIAFGSKDLGKTRSRVGKVLGEERAAALKPDVLYGLHALDDAALETLKRIPPEEFDALAKALTRDPKRAAALAKAYGDKFIDEVRANPGRSLDEVGDVLLMRAMGADPRAAVGAVRGAHYQLDAAKGIGANKTKWERALKTTKNGSRLEGATVAVKSSDAEKATLELTVPKDGGGTTTVTVEIELKEGTALAPGGHQATGGAGAARIVKVEVDAKGAWTARVQVDKALLPENVQFVLGHELDEIGSYVVRKGAGGAGAFAAEAEAGLLVRFAGSRGAAAAAPPITGHDRAAAREFLGVAADVRDLELRLASATKSGDANQAKAVTDQLKNRRETLEKLRADIGLLDPQHLELKLKLLRDTVATMSKEPQLLVVPPGGTRSPFDELVVGSHVAVSRTEWQGLVAGGARVNLTEEKVAHLLRAEPRSRGDFLSSGMYGGHYDPNLQEFVAANPEFAIVLQGPPATAGGVQFRHYRQYRWNDATMPPPRPGDPLYPTVTSVDPRWEAAAFPKTTFSDPQAFLAYANTRIEAFRADLVTAGAAAKSGTAGHMLAGQPTIGVHYTFTPPDTLEIRSVFIDETWIQATAAAQRTPTPVPTGAKQ